MGITAQTGTIPPTSNSGSPNNPLSVFIKEFDMYKGEYYYFWCAHDAGGVLPNLYQQVLSLAVNEVWIWDAYFHQVDGKIFSALSNPGVAIKMITEPKVLLQVFINGVVTNMETAMPPAKRVGCKITIAQSKGPGFADWKMHDRFLIVDQAHVFLIGSSVGNYLNFGESTGAFEITEVNDKELIIKAFDYYWTKLDVIGNVASHVF